MKSISGRKLCKLLEDRGWILLRIKGSHHIYKKTDFPTISVPVHGNTDLKMGTLRGILKAANIDPKDIG
jgi:predicted RNA binding protein YcfA (HicA-like mRNA interferase family)